jgi:DNA topoisomerase I
MPLPIAMSHRPRRRATRPIQVDPAESAMAAGLRYVRDGEPGIRRKRARRGFSYVDARGEPVRDRKMLDRIRSLGIPPAWTDVWICANPRGHLQATGKDAKGRKQYRYHPRWREVRDATKYDRMIAFAEALPTIRARVAGDLALPDLPRAKVLAAVVRLLDETSLRIGNQEYARENASYGLTTLRNEHAEVAGTRVRFHFRGKSGKEQEVDVRDRRVAKIVRRCQELPGYELFQYVDDQGERRMVESADVNEYLQQLSGQEFTAKDFRTWAGTVEAADALRAIGAAETEAEKKHNIAQAIKVAAEHLGNTPAICRKCYVHPGLLEAYVDGMLPPVADRGMDDETREDGGGDDQRAGLRPDERALLALLYTIEAKAKQQVAAS